MTKAVIIISGGLDSTTLLLDAISQGTEVVQGLSFNYGQRHKKELDYAQTACEQYHVPWTVIDLWSSGLPDLLASSESSLVSDTDVPEGHYAEDSMKSTIVPNRNMMMLSIAGAVAVAKKANTVLTGVHAGDHFVYPDCRPEFIAHVSSTLAVANKGFWLHSGEFSPVTAPYMEKSKADIAYRAIELGLPFENTWSCYKGGAIHCGRCGTCVERLEAIDEAINRQVGHIANNIDTTQYADTEFWKQAVANAK